MSRLAELACAVVLSALLAGCSGAGAGTGAGSSKSVAVPGEVTGSAVATKPAVAAPAAVATGALVTTMSPDALEPPSYTGYERLPSFTYHHVDPKLDNSIAITPATFEAQLQLLRDEGFHPITARQLAEHHSKATPLPDKPVMITFDDGWKNQYQFAAPLLRKYGFVATFFVNPQPIGRGSAYMTRAMLEQLSKDGHDIESHTWTHLALTRRASEDELEFQKRAMKQMALADDWLKQVTGHRPVALCYPFGYYDMEAVSRAKAAGYQVAFTTDEGVADARSWDAMIMKRFTVNRSDSVEGFKSRLHSGVLSARGIQPPPGTRVRGITTTVTVDITDVPAGVGDIKLSSGSSMKATTIVRRGGRRYAIARLNKARVGTRQIIISGVDGAGRRYYYSWSLGMGN
jgi:peptidoglycan/xylan/chitin deacetylase (PgdA/CDA1 family)